MEREEIERIAKVYRRSEEDVVDIINLCKKLRIEPVGSLFYKPVEEIEQIHKLFADRGLSVNVTKSCFKRTYEDIAKILYICDKARLKPVSEMFDKDPEKLAESVVYIATNNKFRRDYLKSNIVVKDASQLQESMPCLFRLGLLKYLGRETYVLELTADEIIERTAVMIYLGVPLHPKGRYTKEEQLNKVYSLSREKYAKYCEQHIDNETAIRGVAQKKAWILDKLDEVENKAETKEEE